MALLVEVLIPRDTMDALIEAAEKAGLVETARLLGETGYRDTVFCSECSSGNHPDAVVCSTCGK